MSGEGWGGLAIVLMLSIAGSAAAQEGIFPLVPKFNFSGSEPEQYDESDLGKAMAICARHQFSNSEYATNPPSPVWQYAKDWDDCYRARDKWEKTETGRKHRAAEEQETQDRAFVKRVGS